MTRAKHYAGKCPPISGWYPAALHSYISQKQNDDTNASIGYRSGQGWEIALFARNLFGANYIQNLTIQAGNSGLILGSPSDPRVIGVTLRARQ